MKHLFITAILAASSASIGYSIPLVNGGPVTLAVTATPLAASSLKVQRLTLRMVPGYACKAYVGTIGHSRTSLVGVYSVLYPNATGGWSEEFTIEDPRGTDGIDLSTLAVSGDCPGEQLTMMYFQTGTLSATNFRVFKHGLVTPAAGQNEALWSGSTTAAALVRVQVVPGMSGKIRVKGQTRDTIAILYPNVGNPAQSSARSERLTLVDRFGQLRPDLMFLSADVPGEGALVLAATYN